MSKLLTSFVVKYQKTKLLNMATAIRKSSNQSGKVEVNGANIYYEKNGTGNHALLLLPGALGCCKTDFKPQLEGINQENFTVVGWDPRGYGNSRPPDRDFPLKFFHRDAKDAKDLMLALGFQKFSLLGWSDGGNTAAILAANYPEYVNKLVIWGMNSYVTKEELEGYEQVRDITKWSPRMREPMIEMYGEEYFAKKWSEWVDAFIAISEKLDGDVYKTELPNIRAPTLIIHGMKDFMVPMFHPQYIHENVKGSILECWDDGKHNLHLRFADKFNKRIEEFLMTKSSL